MSLPLRRLFIHLKLPRVITSFGSRRRHISQIPGPRRLPLLGNAHLFGPFGPYSFPHLVEAHEDFYRRYGPVVRLDLGSVRAVLLFEPDDVEKMFRSEGPLPERPVFEALFHYRRCRPDKYASADGGLITGNGEEWRRLRRPFNWLLQPSNVALFRGEQERLATDFAQRLKAKNEGHVTDFVAEATLYTQEAIGLVCFGRRLGCFDSDEAASDGRRVAAAARLLLDGLGKTVLEIPVWKIFKTRGYRQLEEGLEFLSGRCEEHILSSRSPSIREEEDGDEEEEEGKKNNNPFLSHLLRQKELGVRDVSLILEEAFLGGIETTATTLGMCVYHLATHPEKQEKLAEELKKSPADDSNPRRNVYLHACIQETLRLAPTAVANARILPCDVTVSGHRVPAGTLFLGCQPVIGKRDDLFEDPLHFVPERWLKSDATNNSVSSRQNKGNAAVSRQHHPFAFLPFGFGARMCPGRRLAQQELQLALHKIFSQFRVKYVGSSPSVPMVMRLNLVPDCQLEFTFEERDKIDLSKC